MKVMSKCDLEEKMTALDRGKKTELNADCPRIQRKTTREGTQGVIK